MMKPFAIVASLAFAALCVTPFWGCNGHMPMPVTLAHFQLTADAETKLTVFCDDSPVYTVQMLPGVALEIGGTDALCEFKTDTPVKVKIVTIWKSIPEPELIAEPGQ